MYRLARRLGPAVLLLFALTACERTEVDGISSQTGDEAHPPQLDLESFEGCTVGALSWVSGRGELVNNSPATATYEVVVGFSSDGSRIGEGTSWIRDLRSGERASFEAGALLGDRAESMDACEVITINRF